MKSECAFKLAELINNRQIRIICTEAQRERIMEELSVLKQDHIDADTRKKGDNQQGEYERYTRTFSGLPRHVDNGNVFPYKNRYLKDQKAKLGQI